MKRILAIIFILVSSLVFAQVISTDKLEWDQVGPSLTDVQAYTYRYYPDGAATGITLTAVTCTGAASPYVCQVNFPPFTPGKHTLTLTAANIAGESAKSTPEFVFTLEVVPAAPSNVRHKRGTDGN